MRARMLLLFLLFTFSSAKIFTRCSLARKLLKLNAPIEQLAEWVCLVNFESGFNSSKLKSNPDQSKDHGIFQINDRYWCDVGTAGCSVDCNSLLDCDIADDFACARKIHQLTEGNGFNAWVNYQRHCSSGEAVAYLVGCGISLSQDRK